VDSRWDEIAEETKAILELLLRPENLAYVNYNFGIGGEPKGLGVDTASSELFQAISAHIGIVTQTCRWYRRWQRILDIPCFSPPLCVVGMLHVIPHEQGPMGGFSGVCARTHSTGVHEEVRLPHLVAGLF